MQLVKSIFKTFLLSLTIISQVHFAYAQSSASILPPAKTTFFDVNGNPLSSGKVYSYIPGTTTPKTTWQDAAETIPNTNPVVLDAAGRALILGSGNYRQQVYDKNNNLQWDQVTSSTGSGGGTGPISTGDGDLVGTVKPWAGMTAPNQYVFTYGQEVSRTTFAALFAAITSTQAVFCNSGSPILNGLSNTNNFWIGMTVEVACLGAGNSTIISKTATTVTMAANANVTLNTNAVFFPWGRGNGTTTFNLPDFRGYTPAGNDIMGGTAAGVLTTANFGSQTPDASGAAGGAQTSSTTLVTNNLPPYTPAGTIAVTASVPISQPNTFNVSSPGGVGLEQSGGTTTVSISSQTFTGTAQGGTSTPISIKTIQPTKTINYIIKTTPDTNSATASGVTSLGLMTGDIACGVGLTCTGNTISSTSGTIAGNAVYYASSYGAVCNGFTDDTTFIANAIAASQVTGGIVQLPGGQCRVTCVGASCNIFQSSSAVNIQGVGTGAGPGAAAQSNSNVTQLLIDCANCTLFNITSIYPSIFQHFQVNVNPASRPHTGNGIYLAGTGTSPVANYLIYDVGFTNVGTPIRVLRPSWGSIVSSYFDTWGNHAIYLETSAGVEGSGGVIKGKNFFFGTLATTTSPIYSEVGYTIIDGNEILGGPSGVQFCYKNNPAGFTKITNNTIENFSTAGISIATCDGSLASMVMIQNNEFSEVSATATASITTSEYVPLPIWLNDLHITGNVSRNSMKAGAKHIWVQAGKNVHISDNIIEELGANNPTGIQVSGVTINTGLAAPFIIDNNTFTGITSASKYSLASNPSAQLKDLVGMAFASLPANAGNGSQVFVTDGEPNSNPLTGGSTGAMAIRQNGAWIGLGATTYGTGVATALGVNVGTAGSFVVNGGALGTPLSGVATNLTGTAAGLTAGNVTTNANLTGDVTSVGNATTIGANKVTRAMEAQGIARSVIGVTGNATANVADIQGTADQALVVNSAGTALAFGKVNLTSAAGVTGTLPVANGGTGVTTTAGIQALAAISQINFIATGINFNSANTDTTIPITLPTGYTRYVVAALYISGASASISTATAGVFTAAGAGGVAVASTQALTVTSAADATNNNTMVLNINNSSTESYTVASQPNLFFRVVNPQGSAATANFVLQIRALP